MNFLLGNRFLFGPGLRRNIKYHSIILSIVSNFSLLLILFLLTNSKDALSQNAQNRSNDWCIDNNNLPCGHRTREAALANGKCTTNSITKNGSNRGGYVANTASVPLTFWWRLNVPYIGINAQICDRAVIRENASVSDFAVISGNAIITGNAEVYGHARVLESSFVSQYAHVYGNAIISQRAGVLGYARIFGEANVSGELKIYESERVFGNARVFNQESLESYRRTRPQAIDYVAPYHYLINYFSDEDKLIEELGKNDFSVNFLRPSDGKSLLEMALNKNYFKTVEFLLERGADPFIKNDINPSLASPLVSELKKKRNFLLKIILKKWPSKINELVKHLTTKLKMPEYAQVMDEVLPFIIQSENSGELIQMIKKLNRKENLRFSDKMEKRFRMVGNFRAYVDYIESMVNDEASCLLKKSEQISPSPGLIENVNQIAKATCPICLEKSEVVKRDFQYNNCHCNDQIICSSKCLSLTLNEALKGGDYPAKCPGGGGCKGTLEKEDILRFSRMNDGLKTDELTILRYRIAVVNHKLKSLGLENKIKICRSPDCINMVKVENLNSDGHFDCPLCGDDLCVHCGYQHYDIKNCDSAVLARNGDESFKRILHDPKSNIRPCPYCLVPTEKSEACDHMTCKSCDKKWDWRLGKRSVTAVHYSKTDGSEPRTYRVKGDLNPKTNKLYDEYKEDVPLEE